MLLRDRPMQPTSQDPVLVRDRTTLLTSTLLLLVAAAAWVFVVLSSVHGEDMAMPMPLSIPDGLVFTTCWAVMMTAMMLPSALPMVALYGAMQRGAGAAGTKGVPVAVFTLVYLGVWAATGLPVYFAHTLLAGLTGSTLAYAIAVVLVAAGVYQLSPLKQVCLRACRGPPGQPGPGLVPRAVLSRMLLGAHAGARCRRRDGSAVGAAHHGSGRGREAAVGRRLDCADRRECARAPGRDSSPSTRSRDRIAERSPDVITRVTDGGSSWQAPSGRSAATISKRAAATPSARDRKSVVQGKSVDLGGRRIIK